MGRVGEPDVQEEGRRHTGGAKERRREGGEADGVGGQERRLRCGGLTDGSRERRECGRRRREGSKSEQAAD